MTTQQLIELQKSITQGAWHAMPFNQGETIYAFDNARVAETYSMGKHGAEATPNATAIALLPELLSEVIRLRGVIQAALPLIERYSMRSTVLEPSADRIIPAMRAALASQ